MSKRWTFKDVDEKAEHFHALGIDEVWLDEKDPDLPWTEVRKVDRGSMFFGGLPAGVSFTAHRDGIALRWTADLHARDPANELDREKVLNILRELSPYARGLFVKLLSSAWLPALSKRADEAIKYWAEMANSKAFVLQLIEREKQT